MNEPPGLVHPTTPEQKARRQIELLLQRSGRVVQDRSQANLTAGPGVAIREALLKGDEADYLLFAGGKAIATVETKPAGYNAYQIASIKTERTARHELH